MGLEMIDWIVIVGFFLLIVGIGLSYTKKAGKDLESFFLGGRDLPWYIAGISMVATTFAADTPLAVTELVADFGIAGNWFWWSFLAGGMLTTFFFARLWRKAEVLTEVELIEMRYSGKEASFLRGFKSLYLGLFINVIVIAWVNVALITLLQVFFGLGEFDALLYTGAAMLLVAIYSSMAGLLGIAITDVIQFIIAITACIILAIVVVNDETIGGISGLKEGLRAISPTSLDFFPTVTTGETGGGNNELGKALSLGIGSFFAYIGVQWWASWYPGAEPGGGGYIAQRMMSTRTEKDAIYSTLFFQIAHYCIRPWPWILVALCTIVLYNFDGNMQRANIDPVLQQEAKTMRADKNFSKGWLSKDTKGLQELVAETKAKRIQEVGDSALIKYTGTLTQLIAIGEQNPDFKNSLHYTADSRTGYVFAMRDFLPAGLKGLLLVAFFAAYMSTISTQLNWGASYVVNDFYRRFFAPEADSKALILASRFTTVLLMAIGLFVTTQMDSITGAWGFLMKCGAGLGLVLILRWYWWRINAWSEISATIAPFVGMTLLYFFGGEEMNAFPNDFLSVVVFTTIVWITVTFLTEPSTKSTLQAFFDKVEPLGAWGEFRKNPEDNSRLGGLFMCWFSGILFTYGTLFLIGKTVLAEWQDAGIALAVVLVSGVVLKYFVAKTRIFE